MAWAAAAAAALEIGKEWMNSSAQHNANRTNVKLQREQQAWEAQMSNTAIQRRAADIEAAGGNRALAFTNGSEATTPTVTPARVEPYKADSHGIQNSMIMAAQLQNIQANTAKTLADARVAKVDADIKEGSSKQELIATINKYVEDVDQRDLTTEIMRKTNTNTGLETQRLQGVVESVIKMAKQQAREGELDLQALENVAQVGGLEASKASSIVKLILDFFRTMKD